MNRAMKTWKKIAAVVSAAVLGSGNSAAVTYQEAVQIVANPTSFSEAVQLMNALKLPLGVAFFAPWLAMFIFMALFEELDNEDFLMAWFSTAGVILVLVFLFPFLM